MAQKLIERSPALSQRICRIAISQRGKLMGEPHKGVERPKNEAYKGRWCVFLTRPIPTPTIYVHKPGVEGIYRGFRGSINCLSNG
jgi:hypothetical protein